VEEYSRAGKATDDNTAHLPKATNTHSEYAIHIAFSRQNWLHEHASMLGFS